jgi:hypothetical protein
VPPEAPAASESVKSTGTGSKLTEPSGEHPAVRLLVSASRNATSRSRRCIESLEGMKRVIASSASGCAPLALVSLQFRDEA